MDEQTIKENIHEFLDNIILENNVEAAQLCNHILAGKTAIMMNEAKNYIAQKLYSE